MNYETKKQGYEEIFAIRSRMYICCLRSPCHIFIWRNLLWYYVSYLYLLVECNYCFDCLEVGEI